MARAMKQQPWDQVFPITTPSRARVINELFLSGPKSRAEISRATKLTKVTVSEAVDDLLNKGLLKELSTPKEDRPGKPSIPVMLKSDSYGFLAVDLSEVDSWSLSVFSVGGEANSTESIPRRNVSGSDLLELLKKELAARIESAVFPIVGVGIGSPGVITRGGRVISAPNLGWENLDLRTELESFLGLPVVVENDAHLSAEAINTFSEFGNYSLVVRIAGGLGAGLVVDGQIPAGSKNAAGELGHTVVFENGTACACGKKGCLEAYVSSKALESQMGNTEQIADMGRMLGIAISPIVGLLNLDSVVIAVNEKLRSDTFLDAVKNTIKLRTLPISHSGLQVEYSDFAQDIVLRGAASRIMGELLGLGKL